LTDFDGAIWRVLQAYLRQEPSARSGSRSSLRRSPPGAGRAPIEHLQLGFNLLDWRMHEAGIVTTIRDRKSLTVHARSVFLQGILLPAMPRYGLA